MGRSLATDSANPRKPAAAGRSGSEIVVFWLLSDAKCAECGAALAKGSFLRLEADRPLCLACADLDYLVFLPSGDPALTRRAGKRAAPAHAV